MRTWTTALAALSSLAMLGMGAPAVVAQIEGPPQEVSAVAATPSPARGAADIPSPGEPAPASCSTVRVVGDGPLFEDGFEGGTTAAWGPGGAGSAHFRASRIQDLRFEVELDAGSSGDHLVHLQLLTPRGHPYQALTVPVSGQEAARGSQRKVDGYPWPLEVQVIPSDTQGSGAGVPVSLKVPVAGTTIVSSSLYGEWTAEARLDGDTEACASVLFTLEP